MRARLLSPVTLFGVVILAIVGSLPWWLSSVADSGAAPGADKANPVSFMDRVAPRPSPEVSPERPASAPPDVPVCSRLTTGMQVDAGNEAEPWIFSVTVTNDAPEACALGGTPRVIVVTESGDVLTVQVSAVPVPPVPEAMQPDRFLVAPGGTASVGIQWGKYCSADRTVPTVRFVLETEGAEVVSPSVRPPECVSGGDELNLRPLSWLAPPGEVRIVSNDPLFSARVAVSIVELSYPSPDSLRAVIAWRNVSNDAVALEPCPYYGVTVGNDGTGRTDYFYLNCDEAPDSLEADESLFVEVLVANVPTDEGSFGFKLGDGYVDGEHENSKRAWIDYNLP